MKIMFFLNILRKGAGMINREMCFAEQLASEGHKVSILSYFKPVVKMSDEIKVYNVIPTRYRGRLYLTTLALLPAMIMFEQP